jgi:hypothetical protein
MSERCLIHIKISLLRRNSLLRHASARPQRPEKWNIKCKSADWIEILVCEKNERTHGTRKGRSTAWKRLARAKQGSECRSQDQRARMYDVVGQDQDVQPQGPDSYRSKRNAVCLLSTGGRVGIRILLLVDRLVQQVYRPVAIFLGSRKMKTLPLSYRLQKERD